VKPLVKELLEQLHQTNSPDLDKYLIPCHEIKQNNGYDCGVAVISLIKRIRERYRGDLRKIELGEFDFKNDRRKLRKKYLADNN
jgi:Ulp1 family protease